MPAGERVAHRRGGRVAHVDVDDGAAVRREVVTQDAGARRPVDAARVDGHGDAAVARGEEMVRVDPPAVGLRRGEARDPRRRLFGERVEHGRGAQERHAQGIGPGGSGTRDDAVVLPATAATPSPASSSTAAAARWGSAAVSRTTSATGLPMMPPASLTSRTASSIPASRCRPASSQPGRVSGTRAPIRTCPFVSSRPGRVSCVTMPVIASTPAVDGNRLCVPRAWSGWPACRCLRRSTGGHPGSTSPSPTSVTSVYDFGEVGSADRGLWQYPLSCHRSARSCPPRGRTRPVVICSWCCSCCSWRWVRRRVCPVRQPGAAGPRRRPIAPATTWTCAPTPTAAAGRGGSECPSATRRSGRRARCTCACGATARTGAAHPAHPVRPACPRPSSCRVCAAGRRTRSR